MNNRKWTAAQKAKLSASMKESIKRRKGFKPLLAPGISYANVTMKPQEQTAMDSRRNNEYHYRRGLVTAMECILRELR